MNEMNGIKINGGTAKIFGHTVRASSTGGTWLVCKDVCETIGVKGYISAFARLDDDEKGYAMIETAGGKQFMCVINELGLVSLMFRSRKPEARKFRRWVTHILLPSMRKAGTFKK